MLVGVGVAVGVGVLVGRGVGVAVGVGVGIIAKVMARDGLSVKGTLLKLILQPEPLLVTPPAQSILYTQLQV